MGKRKRSGTNGRSGKRRRFTRRRALPRSRSKFAMRRKRVTPRTASAVFKQQVIKTFTYFEEVILDSAFGTGAQATFRVNSLFDPLFTLGGHQPRGFDEWKTHYQTYTVLSSKITATYFSEQTASMGAIAVNKSNITLQVPTITELREGLDYRGRYLERADAGTPTTIVAKWSMKDYPQNIKTIDKSADISADPAFSPLFHVIANNGIIGVDANPMTVHIMIQYKTLLFNRKKIPIS